MRKNDIGEGYRGAMHKPLMLIGLSLVILGLLLLAVFPGSVYKSAKDLNPEKYQDGEKVTVYGIITDIGYIKFFNVTQIVLDGSLKVYAPGEIKKLQVGDEIYLEIQKTASLEVGEHQLTYWTTTAEDIHSVTEMQSYFYIAAISGAIVAVIGLVLRR